MYVFLIFYTKISLCFELNQRAMSKEPTPHSGEHWSKQSIFGRDVCKCNKHKTSRGQDVKI